MAEVTLDAVGLICPLPVLKARKLLAGMAAGATLAVRADDPGAAPDFLAFCEAAGHQLLSERQDGEVSEFLIRKGAA